MVPLLYSYLSVQHDVISYEEQGEEEELVDTLVLQQRNAGGMQHLEKNRLKDFKVNLRQHWHLAPRIKESAEYDVDVEVVVEDADVGRHFL